MINQQHVKSDKSYFALNLILLVLTMSFCTPLNSIANEPLVKNIAVSYSKKTPSFPKSVKDYKLMKKNGYEFVRVFSNSPWVVPISEFDPEQNGGATMSCQPYYWVLRWRSNNQDVTIRASAGLTDYGKYDRVYKTVEGGAGYMEGYSCTVPAFKFGRVLNGNRSNLTDVNFEYQLW